MSEKSLITALRRDYAKLDPTDRKLKIRALVSESPKNRKFIKSVFPEFYAEAFRPSATTKPDNLSS